MKRIQLPLTADQVSQLHVGDRIEISGVIYTGRDAVHKWLSEGNTPPVNLKDGIIYHCGPVVMKKKGKWVVTAAGPTTSAREEPYQAGVIEKFGIRGVIGKGGMGEKTRLACEKFGCVYLHAIGGAAQVLAACVKEVKSVHMYQEFGSPEAIWELQVENFPVVVTIDSHGKSLHREIESSSAKQLAIVQAELQNQSKSG